MKKLLVISLFLGLIPIAIGTSLLTICSAQYPVIYNFDSTTGRVPYGSLTLTKGKLYGMTMYGGLVAGMGNVFSVDTNGNNGKDLLDFVKTNGQNPYGSLTIGGNKLFGMTYGGGPLYNCGVVFSMDTNGNGYKDIHAFCSDSIDGGQPFGTLVFFKGKLYGMTLSGGINYEGTIFSIDTNGNSYKTIHSFNGTDGLNPLGDLIISQNKLFGMTSGGGLYGYGCAFSIDTSGAGYKDILDFNSINGANPLGSLTLLGSTLFGMTDKGGANNIGCVFSVDTNGSKYKDLLDFNVANGKNPNGSLISVGTHLYGMTIEGGANFDGLVFSIDTNGRGYKDMFDFDGIRGLYPRGSLIHSGPYLYGMAPGGKDSGGGVIFKIDTNSVAGINEVLSNSKGATLFPNPNNGRFTIELQEVSLPGLYAIRTGDKVQVEIYNMLGDKIYSNLFNIQHSQFNIDISGQPTGIYMYRLISETGELIGGGKFVIE